MTSSSYCTLRFLCKIVTNAVMMPVLERSMSRSFIIGGRFSPDAPPGEPSKGEYVVVAVNGDGWR